MAVPTGVLVLSVSLAFASALGSSMGPTLHSQLAVASPRLAHWEAAGVAFDYPAAWRVLARDITARHYESIPAVVGTVDGTTRITTGQTITVDGIKGDVYLDGREL